VTVRNLASGFKELHQMANDPTPRGDMARTRTPAMRRSEHLKKKYGMTLTDFDAMLECQFGGCAICGEIADRWEIDHDHGCCDGKLSCGECIRGVLCSRCNRNVGVLENWLVQYRERIMEYVCP
jgi:hypothetical protein